MPRPYRPKNFHTANMPLPERQLPSPRAEAAPPAVQPFITIAQQAGAECPALPQRLVDLLNAREPRARATAPPWSRWDQELIEKVSADNRIPPELITSLETTGYSWIDDLLA